jgi:hypothetical protein
MLMQMIIEYARAEGLKTIEGQVLAESTTMLAMCRELGFSISPDPSDPDTCIVKLVILSRARGPEARGRVRPINVSRWLTYKLLVFRAGFQ